MNATRLPVVATHYPSGMVCVRATTTHDCPRNHDYRVMTARAYFEACPFPPAPADLMADDPDAVAREAYHLAGWNAYGDAYLAMV